MAQVNFDAANVSPQQSFDPIPAGWYNVQIVKSELVPTRAGTGTILKLQLVVLDGDCAKRVIWCNLNRTNPNQQAVDIAEGQLSAICHATGVIQLGDSEQLHGIPFQVRVKVKAAQGNFDASNDCTAFKAVEGQMAGASNGMQPPTAAPQGQPPVYQQPAQQQQQFPPQQQQQAPQAQQQPWQGQQQPAGQQPAPQAQQPQQPQAQQPAPISNNPVGVTDPPPWTQ